MIHPSLEETFGMSIAESMVAGVPVVAGAASGAVPWVLDDGRAGILVDVRDPTDIARAATQLVSSRSHREEVARAAKAFAMARFSPSAVSGAYLSLYEKLT